MRRPKRVKLAGPAGGGAEAVAEPKLCPNARMPDFVLDMTPAQDPKQGKIQKIKK